MPILSSYMIKVLQYGIIAVITALFMLFSPSEDVINTACLIAILIFGVPHGAIDHKIQFAMSSKNSLVKYVLIYVLIGVGYLLWWLAMPLKALIIFILLSAYHFGQELIEDNNANSKQPLSYLLWGSIILINPILIYYKETSIYFEEITQVTFAPINYDLRLAVIFTLGGLVILDLIRLVVNNQISQKSALNLLLFAVYINISYLFLPFLLSFTLYFVVFHSGNAFRHQYLWLKSRKPDYNIISFIKDLSLFSGVAFAGIILTLFVVAPNNWVSLFAPFFIFISLLTLPHSMIFDKLYNLRRVSMSGS